MVELVDTLDLKSNGYLNVRAGSSPACGTESLVNFLRGFLFFVEQKAILKIHREIKAPVLNLMLILSHHLLRLDKFLD